MRQVYFGGISSYDDLGLFLPDGGMDIGTPAPKRYIVDVQGADGDLDLSYAFGGETKFKNRTISLSFIMADYQYRWDEIFSQILTLIHGKNFQVLIDPEREYYWDAFCQVDSAKSDRNKGTVQITLDCTPYRQKDVALTATATPEGTTVTANVTRKTVVPEVTCESNVLIEYDEKDYPFDAGTHTDLDLRLGPGANTLLAKGTGTVTIRYKDGSL